MKKTNGKRNGVMVPRVKQSAQAIWLAGLGALATAGDESSRMFGRLVKRGEQVDKLGRGQMKRLADKAGAMREDATMAIGKRVRLPLDKGVTTALHRIGVPTRSEILALTKRVEALTRAVEKQRRVKVAPKAHKPAAHKPAPALV